ncbi:MarR family winged helix-turn-helix transcriptional regulator [Peribacillus frigoritolerans]|uniref:MarR family winged helix-turn-helix transcriptional regulator n=1 Tax=Peribacillus frigoritolerans TaxID=450367 RepID=UPI003D023C48
MKDNITNRSSTKKEERLGLMLWFQITRIYNQSIRESNQHLKKWNLTAAQFDILVQVGSHERLSQQELANKLFVTKGNITQLLRKMEDLGLINRKQEWKTKFLSLTEVGKELFYEIVSKQEQFQASQFSNLNYKEKKQLLDLLRKIQKP